MPYSKNAPRREGILFAKFALALPGKLLQWVKFRVIDEKQLYPSLSDHLARDAGMSQSDLEPRRHRHPSQVTHHPYG